MNMLSLASAILIILPLSAAAMADDGSEQPQVISLDEIWALKMPGTREVRELEQKNQQEQGLVSQIVRTLESAPLQSPGPVKPPAPELALPY